MLDIIENWTKNQVTEKSEALLEYRVRDFYGPFVECRIEKNGTIRVTPLALKVETPEYSMDDFPLISKLAKEVFSKFGEFTLCLERFEVVIDDPDTAEEAILEKLKKIRLF